MVGSYCAGLVSGCTTDAIYNLEFATAWRVCIDDGNQCGLPVEMVDLNQASVAVVNPGRPISVTDAAPYYVVNGDEKTWVSNGTVDWDWFNFQMPLNYTSGAVPYACAVQTTFGWYVLSKRLALTRGGENGLISGV